MLFYLALPISLPGTFLFHARVGTSYSEVGPSCSESWTSFSLPAPGLVPWAFKGWKWEKLRCCVRIWRGLWSKLGVRSSLNPGEGGTGVTGGCTGEVETSLPCVVLKSLKVLDLRSPSHFAKVLFFCNLGPNAAEFDLFSFDLFLPRYSMYQEWMKIKVCSF